MKTNWIDIILIIVGLILIYQLIRAIIGGSWQTEAIIIAFLFLNLGLTLKVVMDFMKLDMKFDGHIDWHKKREG